MKSIRLQSLVFVLLLSALSHLKAEFNTPGVDFDNYLENARTENKNIILYFHDDRCGICLQMNKTTFVDKQLIEKINQEYICLSVNTSYEKDKKFNEKYKITKYPLFLILDQYENEIHRFGGMKNASQFIASLNESKNRNNTLSYYQMKYEEGFRDADFLLKYCYKMNEAYGLNVKIIDDYFKTQTYDNLHEKRNLKFLWDFAFYEDKANITFESKEFDFLVKNWKEMNYILDEDQSAARMVFLLNDYIDSAIKHKDEISFDRATELMKQFERKEPYFFKLSPDRMKGMIFTKNIVLLKEIDYLEKQGENDKYEEKLNSYIELIWNDAAELNDYAYNYREIHNSKVELLKAKKWVERSLELKEAYQNLFNYASILYELGDYNEAFELSKKSIRLAKENNADDMIMLELQKLYNNIDDKINSEIYRE